jgi:DNA-3-methyladenine glycosylase I
VQKLQLAGFKHSSGSLKTNSRVVPEGSLPVSPLSINGKKRCGWITSQSDAAMVAYHDEEWGIPIYDDKLLFELMVLESAQADMSWSSILALRNDFRVAFMGFDPAVVAKFDEKKIATLIANPRIRIPEAKIRGAIDNAKRVLQIVDECSSLRNFLWGFVNYKPVVSHYKLPNQVPVRTPKSEALSNELLRRGFRNVGPTTIYAFMQAAGLVNDHLVTCFRHQEWAALQKSPTGAYNDVPEVERWSQPDDYLWDLTSNFGCKTPPAFEPECQLNNSRLSSIPCEPVWAELPMIEEAFEDEI